jgi:hypothetical protein
LDNFGRFFHKKSGRTKWISSRVKSSWAKSTHRRLDNFLIRTYTKTW